MSNAPLQCRVQGRRAGRALVRRSVIADIGEGGAYKYLVLIAIHSHISPYTFPISTACLRLILSRVVRVKPLHCAPIPRCLAMAALALDGPAQRGQGHVGKYRGSPMECRGLLRPTGVQAVSLGPLALYFDRDRCHQGHLSCKFTATTAQKQIPIDFSR